MPKTIDGVVCGSCVADILVRPVRLDVAPGEGTLTQVDPIELATGGIVCNSGIAMARLGMNVAALGCVGNDHWASMIRSRLTDERIDARRLVTHPTAATTTAVVLIDSAGQRSFAFCPGATEQLSPALFWENLDLFARSRMALIGYYSLLPNLEHDLELARIDVAGEVVLQYTIPVEDGAARDPQLHLLTDGRLALLWRIEAGSYDAVYYAILESDGSLAIQPIVVSNIGRSVTDVPRLAVDDADRAHIVWADELGIHWAVIDAAGQMPGSPLLLVEGGTSPSLRRGTTGQLYLAWQEQLGTNTQGIYYASLDPDSSTMSAVEEITTIFMRTGQRIEGPVVGLDEEMGYVFWIVADSRDMSSRGWYSFFPRAVPRQKSIKPLQLTGGVNPDGIAVLPGEGEPLLVALSEEVYTPEGESNPQIAVVAVAGDQTPEHEVWGMASVAEQRWVHQALRRQDPPLPAGAEWEQELVVTASSRPSIKPDIVVDEERYVHLAWLETGGFDQYLVVYASTAPQVLHNYNALTMWDVVDTVLSAVLQLPLVLLAVLPMFVLWTTIPLLGLLTFHVITGEEELETARAWIVLVVMLAIEIGMTLLFPPGGMSSEWTLLRWAAPLGTALLSGVLTAFMLRRKQESVMFLAFFLFTGLHGLFQLLVYAFL